MPKNGFIILLIIIATMVAIDLYTFKGVKLLLKDVSSGMLWNSVKWGYWLWSIGVIAMMIAVFYHLNDVLHYVQNSKNYFIPFTAIAILLINVMPKLLFIVFHLMEDLSWLGVRGVRKITSNGSSVGEVMDRFTFLSRLGLLVAGIQFSWLLYGVTKGRFNFKVREETLEFENLPEAFNGLKVVQISDLHIGSFYDNFKEVEKGIDLINSLNPDIIFFTGDLVNNYAWELDGWEDILKKLRAKKGIYSILGNHDYGDYANWNITQKKEENLADLEQRQKKIGFRLLKNESVRLEKEGSFIDLIGVENWGKSSLINYGNLPKAMKNVGKDSFKILLSHDPSHWEEQVVNKTDIDITFSGHTHGMQFGVEIPGIKWSLAKYLYTYWAGLYNVNKQFLYVNRGFGYTLFTGRVGIRPEITLVNFR